MKLQNYSKYISLLSDDIIGNRYEEEELDRLLADKETYANDIVRMYTDEQSVNNITIIFDFLEVPCLILVDERKVMKINPIEYESQSKVKEYNKIMQSRYSQNGQLWRVKERVKDRFYAEYRRVSAMFNTSFLDVLNIVKEAVVLIINDNNASELYDTYINSVLACVNGCKVYYMTEDVQGCAKIAEFKQKGLYKFIAEFQESKKQPYYLKLAINQMYKEGNFLLVKDYGKTVGMYSRILSCSVDNEEENDLYLTCYKLSDVDKFIKLNYVKDKYTSNQIIDIYTTPYITNVKLSKIHKVYRGESAEYTEFEDAVTGLLEHSRKIDDILNNNITPIMEEKYDYYKDKSVKQQILVNGYKVPTIKEKVEEAVRYELLQQYCNVISELIYGSSKQVYLRDIAVFSYEGEKYLTVEVEELYCPRNIIAKQTMEFENGIEKEQNIVIYQDTVQLIRVNAPTYTGSKEWTNYTDYEKGTLVKSMVCFLTQFSGMNEKAYNIPNLKAFIEDKDNTFSNEGEAPEMYDERGSLEKRRLLLYHAYDKINNLSVKDYIMIPRSYKEPHIDVFGDFGSRWNPVTGIVKGNIILNM